MSFLQNYTEMELRLLKLAAVCTIGELLGHDAIFLFILYKT